MSGDLILKRGLVAAEGTPSEEGQNNAMCHTKALRLEEASGIAKGGFFSESVMRFLDLQISKEKLS